MISEGNNYGEDKILPTSSNNKNLETSDNRPITNGKMDRLTYKKKGLSIDTEIWTTEQGEQLEKQHWSQIESNILLTENKNEEVQTYRKYQT